MAARRKANVLGSRNINSTKSLPTILSRKRKNEEDEMQTVRFNIFIQGEISLNYFVCFRTSVVTWTTPAISTTAKTSREFLSPTSNCRGLTLGEIYQTLELVLNWSCFVLVVFPLPPSPPSQRTSCLPSPARTWATPWSCPTTPTPPSVHSLAAAAAACLPTVRRTGGSKPCPGRSQECETPGASK